MEVIHHITVDTPEIIKKFILMTKEERRQAILNFEEEIKAMDGSFTGDNPTCPLKHSFSDGMYVREISIPKGMIITGKIHKHDHPNFLLKGKVLVATEDGGIEILEAPLSMISPSGTKRALITFEDTKWVTVHLNINNEKDISKIEEYVIAKDYKEYEKFIANKNGIEDIDFFVQNFYEMQKHNIVEDLTSLFYRERLDNKGEKKFPKDCLHERDKMEFSGTYKCGLCGDWVDNSNYKQS